MAQNLIAHLLDFFGPKDQGWDRPEYRWNVGVYPVLRIPGLEHPHTRVLVDDPPDDPGVIDLPPSTYGFRPDDDLNPDGTLAYRLSRHPFNPAQTRIIRGHLWPLHPRPVWVALAHLAHERGTCKVCESVWRSADDHHAADHQAAAPAGQESLFDCYDLGPDLSATLLMHHADFPADGVQLARIKL